MLLLPKTPPLTYPNIKKFKGPKMDHFTEPPVMASLIMSNQKIELTFNFTKEIQCKNRGHYAFPFSSLTQVNLHGNPYTKFL